MEYTELKKVENDIAVCQAKLGQLRAETKRNMNDVQYDQLQFEIAEIEAKIDKLQALVKNIKEAKHTSDES